MADPRLSQFAVGLVQGVHWLAGLFGWEPRPLPSAWASEPRNATARQSDVTRHNQEGEPMSNFQSGGPVNAGQPWTVPPPPVQPPKRRRWVPFVAYPAVFLVGAVIGAAGGSGDGTSAASSPQATTTVTAAAEPGQKVTVPGPTKTVPGPVKTVTAPPPQAAAVMADDGVYLVGTDIKPGTYRNGPEGDCYWARLRNTNGDLDSIIANNNGGNQVVTIKRTDKAFETVRCGEWTLVKR